MKKHNIIIAAILAIGAFTSCNDFLDTMPDNRAEIDSEDKIKALLVSAYNDKESIILAEFASDNVDEHNNTYTYRWLDQIFNWEVITESFNESTERYWDGAYMAIASANHAIEAIEKLAEEQGWTPSLKAEKAEALLCRAFAHFGLVNIFAKAYNSQTSGTDLGITYVCAPEKDLDPDYERNTVAEVYDFIDKDIQEALPLMGENYYTVPKWHFNIKAAYAFATRFYLYYEKWEECIKYADLCLGDAAKSMLRNWSEMAAMTQSADAIQNEFIDANANANLLMSDAISRVCMAFGAYTTMKKYSHGSNLVGYETANAENVWGRQGYYMPLHSYPGSNYEFTIFWKSPRKFEYTDPVAGIGYYHTTYPSLTSDECLLNRAEAKIMLGLNESAAEDMNLWVKNIIKTPTYNVTVDRVVSFYNSIEYAYDQDGMNSTQKKHLNPKFAIGEEGSVQECMLQCVLGLRRIETLQMGLRWYDIKRYGIEIPRRVVNASGSPVEVKDVLKKDDPRQAFQIPSKCIDAGVKPNPR